MNVADGIARIASEVDEAVRHANLILDDPSRDPDSAMSVLARQFLRHHEKLSGMRAALFKGAGDG